MKPKVICFCGSIKFSIEMACLAWMFERDYGYITLGWHLLPDNHPDLNGTFKGHHAAENAGKKEH